MKKKLQRQLTRCIKRMHHLKSIYSGKETSVYNFYAGWELGYVQGKISVLEDIVDEVSGETE